MVSRQLGGSKKVQTPSLDELKRAHEVFYGKERRALFYRAAMDLFNLSLEGKTSLKPSEAIGVLLLTWNEALIRRRKLKLEDIEALVKKHWDRLREFRQRRIEDADLQEESEVRRS